jgi:hypothetical protein
MQAFSWVADWTDVPKMTVDLPWAIGYPICLATCCNPIGTLPAAQSL